jgi:hypothetical protein
MATTNFLGGAVTAHGMAIRPDPRTGPFGQCQSSILQPGDEGRFPSCRGETRGGVDLWSHGSDTEFAVA